MNDSPRLVWHCENRLTNRCKSHYNCRGTSCSSYKLKEGSYAIEKKYLKPRKETE